MGDEDLKWKKEEWLKKVKSEGKMKDPTEDHKFGLKALQNPTRRNILKSMLNGSMNYSDLKEKFGLDDVQAKLHLNFLEEALYIEKEENNNDYLYYLTPRGEAYLENADYS
ncbi:putative transcriptional regulator, ArsR family [Methanohalobium evestigatum Z-7303]|uniref:Putative transcriptional regulator, ArsR family n=1 Tax=Methanohalobium evestigatum (strain ATCC BAA-1072 / DSM 3721 / NBRC 107634 / OCM 161 / Z-7303) TaxID=644295 RepID=D7E7U1_METEZ|nr:winged helix-turn-helix domain-containing protein [Methanohalobium evestigatum]ADI74164.1 putative transcriptional regulator, ArsR family [Methanohalobium evestigatum Z-7303]